MDSANLTNKMSLLSQKLGLLDDKIKSIQAYVDQRIDSYDNDLEVLESRINNLRG